MGNSPDVFTVGTVATESTMLIQISSDLQPHVDTIHRAAVETLRPRPDPDVLESGMRAHDAVLKTSPLTPGAHAIAEIGALVHDAFDLLPSYSEAASGRLGHYIAGIVADLGRTIDAVDRGDDVSPFVRHAQSVFTSIPRRNAPDVFEIDLSDREQLARLLETGSLNGATVLSETQPEPLVSAQSDLHTVEKTFTDFVGFAERLLENNDDAETLTGLVVSLAALESAAAATGLQQITRIAACALRVVESHHSAGQTMPLDAVEFVIACRRIIPMMLECVDDPTRFNRTIDALVDQSTFVLLELRRGTRPLANLWPEPDEAAYAEIDALPPQGTDITDGFSSAAYSLDPARIPEPEPDTRGLNGPGSLSSLTAAPNALAVDMPDGAPDGRSDDFDDDRSFSVRAMDVEDVSTLLARLTVQSGGQQQRSCRFAVAIQDVAETSDRMRYLIRSWREGQVDVEGMSRQIEEITADLALAATEMESLRDEFDAVVERQHHIHADLNSSITRLRTMPLSHLVAALERTVVSESERHHKRARLMVQGDDAKIDLMHANQILQALQEIVGNAVEHGIESPAERRSIGKREAGIVRLRSFRNGRQTVIQVIDDGAGIDFRAVIQRAAELGYPVPPKGMTRERAIQYIFLPGFSSRESEGRRRAGIGLNMVNGAVAEARGTVTVHSEVGRGTMFTLRLPLMSLLVPTLIVAVSTERFAIPLDQVTALDRSLVSNVEASDDGHVATIAGEQWPAADLGALLGLRSAHHVRNEHGQFLEVPHDGRRWLLKVDRIIGHEAISLQSLNRQPRQMPGIAGSATLASNEHALVIDLLQALDGSARRNRRNARKTASLSHVPFALIVDDSISVRRSLSQSLETTGWRVVEARDAFEAREFLESVAPDLLVIDLDLPAHGALQIIRAARAMSDVPVLGLNPHGDGRDGDPDDALGVTEFLAKPIDPDQFLSTVQRMTQATT